MASTDQSSVSSGGDSVVGRRLNPAAPVFIPRVPKELNINNHFYWYRRYSSPPTPSSYSAAVSPARLTNTIQVPVSYIPFYHQPYGNHYLNPRPNTTIQPPSPPPRFIGNHHISTATETTTEPDPIVGQGFVFRKNGRRGDSSGRGHRSNTNRRKAWKKKYATVAVESNGREITTVMIRNIPNKYTRELIIEFLDKHCQEMNEREIEGSNEVVFSAYDFLYLPMDFKSGMNKGYAFVNFTKAISVEKFVKACNRKAWDLFSSKKRIEIASARIQGKEELVNHFERMTYPLEEYAAVYFVPPRGGSSRDGSPVSQTAGGSSRDGSPVSQTVMVGHCHGLVKE